MCSPKNLSSNKLKQIRKLKQKKFRNQTDYFLSEGIRSYQAAMGTKEVAIRELILTENFQRTDRGIKISESAQKRGIDVYLTDDIGMKSISEDLTPPGIVFTVKKRHVSQQSLYTCEDTIILYLDRVTEPGNMGSILRSACWFGVKTIVLGPECVEPWNSKSVRASAGAIFEADIYTDIKFSLLRDKFRQKSYQIVATVVSKGIAPDKWEIGPRNIICFGQEANGLSKEIIKHADLHICIPGRGNLESLNLSVATGILLFEATKMINNDLNIRER
jgi:TrmH family RNA methyltransferase